MTAHDTKAHAYAKVQRALDRIEAAQNQIGEACSELSGICGAHPEWERLGKLYDKIKAHWYDTRDRLGAKHDAGKLDLDEMARARVNAEVAR